MQEIEKQKLLIELILGNADLFARCNTIIQPKFFDSSLQKAVKFSQDYFEKYHAIPSAAIIKGETGISIQQYDALTRDEITYTATEVEQHCRNAAVIDAIFQAPDLHEKGDYETIWKLIKDASSISLNNDLGISYFANVEERLKDLLNNSPVISTGWSDVDEALGGGLSRQELLLFAANSGIGKSIVMANLSVNLVRQGYNVIYISLELADRVVAKRFDSMVTSISQSDILRKIEEVSNKVNTFKNNGKTGELFIKRMPESVTTANDIRAYLKEFEQKHAFRPDILVIDYIDLMASNRNISAENIWLADKYKTEECRSIGFDYDCAIVTASQLGRGALEAEKVHQGHIQGGISKVQTCDLMISIIQNDLMRATGEYQFEYTKTRNSGAVGSSTLLRWDPIALRVSDWDDSSKPTVELQLKKNTDSINTILNTNGSLGMKPNIVSNNGLNPSLLDLIGKK